MAPISSESSGWLGFVIQVDRKRILLSNKSVSNFEIFTTTVNSRGSIRVESGSFFFMDCWILLDLGCHHLRQNLSN